MNLVKNDINGLITSVNDGSTSAFMWEWFTTKPRSDMPGGTGEVHFVRYVPFPRLSVIHFIDPIADWKRANSLEVLLAHRGPAWHGSC
jgi:hypothetical protein